MHTYEIGNVQVRNNIFFWKILWTYYMNDPMINPLQPRGAYLYPLKTAENL